MKISPDSALTAGKRDAAIVMKPNPLYWTTRLVSHHRLDQKSLVIQSRDLVWGVIRL